jgi:hypothetical protein
MATKKMVLGSIVRLTSFAHKPVDGAPEGYSASPEDTPEGNRNVFLCMLIGIEPQCPEGYTEEAEKEKVNEVLRTLGYFRAEDLVQMGMMQEVPRG